ncbi:DUF349 domain-containing protein [Oxalobacter sp. OttesenSCG-928-P03]|nr:DUF349 domain-containing protein [Oxalobacter sp. OttesenSCG-928-P03]
MFDFLLQRFGKKQPDSTSFSEEKKNAQQAALNEARQAAILQAEQLPENESDAVAFILQSNFADARLIAAQKVYSKDALEQVRKAMRNTDRRVTRLMQSRLDEMTERDRQQNRIQTCIDSAENLKNEPHLLPNLVADLDRQWEAVRKTGNHDAAQIARYERIREEIGKRLADQASLQRQVMDTLAGLRKLEEDEAGLAPAERAARLNDLLAPSEAWSASQEWGALPRQLMQDFDEAATRLKDHADRHTEAFEVAKAREDALDEWERAGISALKPREVREKWQSLPPLHNRERMAALQARFDALISQAGSEDRSEKPDTGQKLSSAETASLFSYSLLLMQKAIQEGAVREASAQNDQISRLDFSVFEPTAEQKALLAELRAELKNLVGWARWGGQASREELIRIVESLPDRDHTLEELAAAVVDAREKWKALNESSGMASRSQWQQFDAACNRAYAPVLEYARSQAIVREQNVLKAQSLIDGVRETLSALNLDAADEKTDWRSLVEYQRRMQRAWQQIGPIARKEKKRLDAAFEQVMRPLNDPLKAQAKIEVAKRKALIDEVRKLDPEDRKASRAVRQLQEQWQESARQFPLDNREDQKLWQQFRSASEAVFSHRARLNEVADKERLEHLRQKENICEKLQTEHAKTIVEIKQALKNADAAWRAAGPVPKERESEIQARYDSAVGVLLARMQTIRDQEKIQQVETFFEKLAICHKLENAIPDHPEMLDSLKALWDRLPPDAGQEMLDSRFEKALKALTEKSASYREELVSRQPELQERLLRLEIMASIDSPPEFAERRRQIQMEVLKDALSGNRNVSEQDQLNTLCAMPVLTDAASAERLFRLLRKINGLPV